MTDDTRAALLDLAMVSIAAVAAVYVLKTPSLRRVLTYALFTAAPQYLWRETTRAWAEAGATRS